VGGSTNFYNQLFGWTSQDMGEEAGHYNMFFQGDKMVAAAGPLQNPQQPPAWSTYVKTDDANAVAQKVTANGGQVLMPPFAVMDQGSMAIFMDPAGAAFAVWQPDKMIGAGLFNTPVSLGWNELHSRDLEKAKDFYPKVFGWGVHSNVGDMGEYVEWQVNERSIAGAMTMPPQTPAQVPSFWLTYFAVESCEAAVEKATSLGARVMAPCMDTPAGRFAVLSDPHGGVFGVIALSSRG
jgi:predicted enzyme related to lactoylglutathione lyase